MGKAGRPAKSPDRHAISVRIEQRHLTMLDELLQDDVRIEFRVSREAVQKRAAADGKYYYLERRVHVPTERRRLLGEIVEWYRDLRAASTVKILVPREGEDPATERAVDEWVSHEESRLTERAPAVVQVALAKIALRRLERQDPEALVRILRAGRATDQDEEE